MLGGGNNKGVMSVVYGAIVFAITIVFIVQFRPNSGQKAGKITQECVANVRDRCITPKEFFAEYGLVAPRGMDQKQLSAMGIRRQVLNGLVERALLNQDAKRLGIVVSDAEINRELARGRFRVSLPVAVEQILSRQLGLNDGIRMIPVTSRKTKKFSYKVYKRMVRLYTNRSPVEFKLMQRRELIADRMRKLIESRASVTEKEAFEAYKRSRSTAKLNYVKLDKQFFQDRYVDLSDTAVKQWMEQNAKKVDEVWSKRKAAYPAGCRRVRHLLVKVKSDSNPNGHSRDEAQKIIEDARKRLEQGESFALIAQSLSEDDTSAEKGGDLGCFKKGKFPKAFDEAVFGTSKPGVLEDVTETPYGLHLIDVTLITSEDADEAQSEAKFDVARDMKAAMDVDAVMKEFAKQVRQLATKGSKLQEAVDQAIASLDERYATDKDKKKSKKTDKEDQDKAGKKQRPDGYPTVETTGTFSRLDDTPIDDVEPGQDLVDMAFKLNKPGDVASKLVAMKQGYAIIALREKHEATRREFKKDRDRFIEGMRAIKAHDLLVNYVQHLREQAKGAIKISERWAREPKPEDEKK